MLPNAASVSQNPNPQPLPRWGRGASSIQRERPVGWDRFMRCIVGAAGRPPALVLETPHANSAHTHLQPTKKPGDSS